MLKRRSPQTEFGATGQFGLSGLSLFRASRGESGFCSTLGMERIRTVLLLGLGPLHLQLLAELARQPQRDLDVVLVHPQTTHLHAPLLGAWVAGELELADAQVPLAPLLQQAGARQIVARCAGVDADNHSLLLDHGPAAAQPAAAALERPSLITFDAMSVDVEAEPSAAHLERWVPGASIHGRLLRPAHSLAAAWAPWLDAAVATSPPRPWRLNVLGSDATAVELACAMRRGLARAGLAGEVRLISAGQKLLPGVRPRLRQRALTLLQAQGVQWLDVPVAALEADAVVLADGRRLASDAHWLSPPVAAPDWAARSGLALGPQGELATHASGHSLSHPRVFAAAPAGSGGLPVAQAQRLARALLANVQATLDKQPLADLPGGGPATLACAAGLAAAQWGPLVLSGRWVWRRWLQQQRALVQALRV